MKVERQQVYVVVNQERFRIGKVQTQINAPSDTEQTSTCTTPSTKISFCLDALFAPKLYPVNPFEVILNLQLNILLYTVTPSVMTRIFSCPKARLSR